MAKFYLKLLLVMLVVGFCIFFGVDLATRGVERIQGPFIRDVNQGNAVYKSNQTDNRQESKNGSKLQTKQETKAPKETEPRVEMIDSAGVSRIANKAGDLLQIMAHYGIRWFVALFDAVSG